MSHVGVAYPKGVASPLINLARGGSPHDVTGKMLLNERKSEHADGANLNNMYLKEFRIHVRRAWTTHSRSVVEGRRLDGWAQKCVREFGSPKNLHEHDNDWS